MEYINIFKLVNKGVIILKGLNWSIKFPTSENVSLFCIHLSIVKALLSQYEVITQDIVIGSG